MSVLGRIRRIFSFVDVDEFKLLYNVYIRPHLEFCVQAWVDYGKGAPQATKMVYGFGNLKYEERLERLNQFLLQYRMRSDIIETYKIISGLEDMN